MPNISKVRTLLQEALQELHNPDPDNGGGNVIGINRPIAKVRFRLLRAQYNRDLFPEQYNDNNPDGLYSGKDLQAVREGKRALNVESNAWLDLTGFNAEGVELNRDALRRAGLAYKTLFRVNEGYLQGNGTLATGEAADWEKVNPRGANLSDAVWRTSIGYTLRVHFSDEGEYRCEGSIADFGGDSFAVKVS